MGRSNSVDTFLDFVEMFYNIITIVFLILFVIGFFYLFSRGVVYGGGPSVVYGGGPSVVVNRTTVSGPSRAPRFRSRR